MTRLVHRLLVVAAAGLLASGCGPAAVSRPAASPTLAVPDPAFTRIDPCALATADQVSAVPGEHAEVNNGDTENPALRRCVYTTGHDDSPWTLLIAADWHGSAASDWLDAQARNQDGTRQVPGLGDRAIAFTERRTDATVEVLKGAVIVTVSFGFLHEETVPGDIAAYLPKLQALAATVVQHI